MGPSLRWDALHSIIFNTDLVAKEGDLLPESIGFLLQPDSSVDAVGRPGSGVGQREMRQRYRVNDR
jgi:hypothetical protein